MISDSLTVPGASVLGERARSRPDARARATAAAILDTPHVAPRYVRRTARLRPSPRRRLGARSHLPALPHLGALGSRRRLAAAVVAAQVALLLGLVALPAFHVHGIVVRGTRMLSPAEVLRTAGIAEGQSIFTVDGNGARRALSALHWVRSATVETELPATVRITVVEEDAVMRVHRASGDLLVAVSGATLPVADAAAEVPPLPVLDDRRLPVAGMAPAPPGGALLTLLAQTAQSFPSLTGTTVGNFRWRPDGVLEIVATPGWRAVLGHVDDPDRLAEMPAQLAALGALHGRLDLTHPSFGYIDLENARAPAVGGPAPQPGG